MDCNKNFTVMKADSVEFKHVIPLAKEFTPMPDSVFEVEMQLLKLRDYAKNICDLISELNNKYQKSKSANETISDMLNDTAKKLREAYAKNDKLEADIAKTKELLTIKKNECEAWKERCTDAEKALADYKNSLRFRIKKFLKEN